MVTPALRAVRAAAEPRYTGRPLRGAEPRHGRRRRVVGPITSVWFVGSSAASFILRPMRAFWERFQLHGVRFLLTHGHVGLVAFGAVFLTVTGAEALYADLGHFGRRPIQTAWLAFVLPSLTINYLGQGALVLARPETLENPFFLLYPNWALLPMVGTPTAATIIASQAVITGAYSMTQQIIQLGLLPRMEIRRTSETEKGQIYIPVVNWLLLLLVLFLVIVFKSSSALRIRLRHRRYRHDGGHDHHGLLLYSGNAGNGRPRLPLW